MQDRRDRPTTVEIGSLATIDEARVLMPDIQRLQDIQYEALQPVAAEYARSQDIKFPLWSVCHFYRPANGVAIEGSWRVNWTNIEQMYVQHDLTLEEIARFSGVPLRSIAGRSGKYGWAQAKRTRKMLRESEDIPDLKTMEEQVRKEKIAEFLTQSGYEMARHAMQALITKVDKIEARDIPALITAATKVMSMGTGMPESYRHSRVENPLAAAAQQTNVNILSMTEDKFNELVDRLEERRAVLEGEVREIPQTS